MIGKGIFMAVKIANSEPNQILLNYIELNGHSYLQSKGYRNFKILHIYIYIYIYICLLKFILNIIICIIL